MVDDLVYEEPTLLSVVINGVYVDPLRVILPLTHLYGRGNVGTQPEAPSVSFAWLGPLTFNYGSEAVGLEIGSKLTLEYGQGGGGIWDDIWDDQWSGPLPPDIDPIPRKTVFTGRITDLSSSTEGEILQTQVTAIGITGEAYTFPVGWVARPIESEYARVQAISLSSVFRVINEGNTFWQLNARDAEVIGLVEGLQALAGSTGAIIWEDGDGALHYSGSLDRAIDVPEFTLEMGQIETPVEWSQEIGNLNNQVTVFYGAGDDGGVDLRAYVTVTDGETYGPLGRQSLTIQTRLANEDSAQAYATLVLRHWSKPYWDAPSITVPMILLDQAAWKDVYDLEIGKTIEIEGVTSQPSTPSGNGLWIVEGWAMTYDRTSEGILMHSRQIAVSDLERWGNLSLETETTSTVIPDDAPLGSAFSITATVKDQDGVLVASGTVEVWDGSRRLASGSVTAGVAVLSATPVLSGTRTLVVLYTGTALYAPSDDTQRVEVTPVTDVTVSMTASPDDPKAGQDSVTLKATVSNSGAPGTILWQKKKGSGSWTDHNTNAVSAGKASRTWNPDNSDGGSWQWRAVYQPSSPEYNGATSSAVSLDVLTKSTKTLTYNATNSASYQSDGDKRGGVDDCYQGYYSGTNGNQKSIAAFENMNPDWSGYTITKVELQVQTPHWQSAAGGTLVIGSTSTSGAPDPYPGGTTDRQRQSMDRNEKRWITLGSWADALPQGGARGIVFGPGPSTSGTYYGYVTGTGSDRPTIRVTGYTWS